LASTKRKSAGGSKGPASSPAAARPDRDREQGQLCARVALDRQAREVRLLFVGELLGIAEYFVLATVHNRRQARAIRDTARETLKAAGFGPPLASSEDPDGRWSLYDWGVVVLHVFDDEGRRHFDLDGLWAGAEEVPIDMTPLAGTPSATAAPNSKALDAATSPVKAKPASTPRAKPERGSAR